MKVDDGIAPFSVGILEGLAEGVFPGWAGARNQANGKVLRERDCAAASTWLPAARTTAVEPGERDFRLAHDVGGTDLSFRQDRLRRTDVIEHRYREAYRSSLCARGGQRCRDDQDTSEEQGWVCKLEFHLARPPSPWRKNAAEEVVPQGLAGDAERKRR